jgi:hypothetical protein
VHDRQRDQLNVVALLTAHLNQDWEAQRLFLENLDEEEGSAMICSLVNFAAGMLHYIGLNTNQDPRIILQRVGKGILE